MDHNEDGKKDLLNMEIQVPLGNTESVNIIQLLLFLDYKLHVSINLRIIYTGDVDLKSWILVLRFTWRGPW